ncbi:hypothetical protein O181_070573 [Austropuccinia psidii MF-1]|uniref:Uncharacterized protein n=1 Tax=Austropuccinia psidii MF-1 TaxID=1389203 RepID=A0A9Q3I7D9_9BASI|nr:hypothetical protein [Austropuccinia psidii MF-1]
MKQALIEIIFQYREPFASENEPLGALKVHEGYTMLNVERPYIPLLRRPYFPASPRVREALKTGINEMMKLSVPRYLWHNEEVEVTTCHRESWCKKDWPGTQE